VYRFGGAVALLAVCICFGGAEEIRGKIVMVNPEAGTITFSALGKDKQYGEPKKYSLAPNAKIKLKATKKGVEDTVVPEGLKGKVFGNIPEKGLPAVIEIQDDRVMEIIILPPPGKKKMD